MYAYEGKDNYMESFWKSFLRLSFYETESEVYGVTDGFTITLLGTNFNFAKKVK